MRWKSALGAVVLIAFAGYIVQMGGCASMQQSQDQVFLRNSGEKLQIWKTLPAASEIHWPYAWATVAAYQDANDPKRTQLKVSDASLAPDKFLEDRGWRKWDEIPSIEERADEPYHDDAARMRGVHLRAGVWSNQSANQVVVAFGGTAAASLDDWKANFRWLVEPLGGKPDEYDVLTDTFVKVFKKAYHDRAARPDGAWLNGAEVISTGHSLGGGLAQRFAYSYKTGDGILQVKRVYAFDPSPVTGKHDAPFVKEVAPGLTIYRIYNRGETLASVRSILQLENTNNAHEQGQTWIDIRYRDNWSWRTLLPSGGVHAHGMFDLACFMAKNLPPSLAPKKEVMTDDCLVGGAPLDDDGHGSSG